MPLPLRTPLHGVAVALLASVPALPATETDNRILAAAKGSYNFKTYLKDDRIKIIAKNGAVTLTGEVADEFHRALAEETLAGLPGVRSVNNQLNVMEDSGGIRPDTTLRARVQVALLFHRDLSALKTRVLVNKGTVTLQGEADNQAQKTLATEYVKGLDGVVQVVNEMTVAGGAHRKRREIRKKIDDASLTAQVKMALLFNRSTSALNTKVQTENAVVHLTGKARSRAEKDLVTRMVRNIEGIRAIRNQMVIEP